QPGRGAHRQPRRRRLHELPAFRDRRPRRRTFHRAQAPADADGSKRGTSMMKRRGRIARTLLVLGSAGPTIVDGVRGLWRSDAGRKWMVPLLVFVCVSGLLLIVAAGIEALAPFVYAIF